MSQNRRHSGGSGSGGESGNKCASPGGGGWYWAPQGKPSPHSTPRPRTGVHGSYLGHLDKVLACLLYLAAPADMVISQYFREHHELGYRERGIIAEVVFAVLRRKVESDQFTESGIDPACRRLVLLDLLRTIGREAIAPLLNPVEAG